MIKFFMNVSLPTIHFFKMVFYGNMNLNTAKRAFIKRHGMTIVR